MMGKKEQRSGHENKGLGHGNHASVGPQGTGAKRSGGKVKAVNNPKGMEPTAHGSKSANLSPQGKRSGL